MSQASKPPSLDVPFQATVADVPTCSANPGSAAANAVRNTDVMPAASPLATSTMRCPQPPR